MSYTIILQVVSQKPDIATALAEVRGALGKIPLTPISTDIDGASFEILAATKDDPAA